MADDTESPAALDEPAEILEIVDAEALVGLEPGTRIQRLVRSDGIHHDVEVVRVTCPDCAESFTGTKRDAGGFLAGHGAYHAHEEEQSFLDHLA